MESGLLRRPASLLALVLLFGATIANADSQLQAEPQPLYIGLHASSGYHYSSGDYGNSRDTEVMYVPFVGRAEVDLWTVELELAWIRINGPEGIFAITGGDGGNPDDDSKRTESGFGDVLLRGSYTLLPWTEWMPYFDLGGEVKFPTARESDGLGTGAFDFELGGSGAWVVGAWTPFVGLGYRFQGNADDFDLDDVFLVSAGVVYRAADQIDLGMFFDFREASASTSDELIEFTPSFPGRPPMPGQSISTSPPGLPTAVSMRRRDFSSATARSLRTRAMASKTSASRPLATHPGAHEGLRGRLAASHPSGRQHARRSAPSRASHRS